MAARPTKLFSKTKTKTSEQSASLFTKRTRQRGVVWTDINWENFLLLLGVCVRENIGVGIYSASGGRGICFKLYRGGKVPDQEYADTAEEFDEMILGVLDNLGEVVDDSAEEEVAD
jgi:hypothetical protein